MTILYEDARIVCDDDGVTIRRYYFPVGDKRIHYADMRGVEQVGMQGWLSGRMRIWGSGDLRHWYHLDTGRPGRDTALVIDKGEWVRAVITPDDPSAVRRVLEQKGVAVAARPS